MDDPLDSLAPDPVLLFEWGLLQWSKAGPNLAASPTQHSPSPRSAQPAQPDIPQRRATAQFFKISARIIIFDSLAAL